MQSANGLGLQAIPGKDNCMVSLRFPQDTIPKWVGFSHLIGFFNHIGIPGPYANCMISSLPLES